MIRGASPRSLPTLGSFTLSPQLVQRNGCPASRSRVGLGPLASFMPKRESGTPPLCCHGRRFRVQGSPPLPSPPASTGALDSLISRQRLLKTAGGWGIPSPVQTRQTEPLLLARRPPMIGPRGLWGGAQRATWRSGERMIRRLRDEGGEICGAFSSFTTRPAESCRNKAGQASRSFK